MNNKKKYRLEILSKSNALRFALFNYCKKRDFDKISDFVKLELFIESNPDLSMDILDIANSLIACETENFILKKKIKNFQNKKKKEPVNDNNESLEDPKVFFYNFYKNYKSEEV